MSNIDLFKPIKMFGFCLILMGAVGLIMHFLLRYNVSYAVEFVCFILFVSFFHVLIGIGVIFKKRWGYYFFKFYLYILYLAIPIGTYVSIKTFNYIKKNNIENLFK
jgi:hypothetical protein